MVRIMGIDPGSRVLGYGLVVVDRGRMTMETCGAIRAKVSKSLPERLVQIHRGLTEVLSEGGPDGVAIEEMFLGRNAQSAIRLGEARGVALLCAAQAGLEIFEYPTATVKKSVTGLGRADKEQVARMVQRILGLSEIPRPRDATDALAVGICHGHRCRSPQGSC